MADYVCDHCKDTHLMPMGDRYVPCTRCPTPCETCRQAGRGAFCEDTPCSCDCHKKTDEPFAFWSEDPFAAPNASIVFDESGECFSFLLKGSRVLDIHADGRVLVHGRQCGNDAEIFETVRRFFETVRRFFEIPHANP